jgi:uncharacterized surface protein with fasciclin (FAS1) repeats
MTNRLSALAIAAAATLAIIPAGASAGGGTKGNLVAAAMGSKDHQTLVAAVKAAGLVDTLATGGPFTVFAPTDAAFARLPAGTVDTLLQPTNRDRLRAVLTYHVVPGKVTSADLVEAIRKSGGQAALKTVQGGTITASLSGASVVITDAAGGTAMVTNADLVQSNGVIHVTDAVSLPM